MDMSPSLLSRKLNPSEADTQRFNLDDLEAYLRASGDAMAVVEYLLAKYAPGAEEDRKQRAQARVVELLEHLGLFVVAVEHRLERGAAGLGVAQRLAPLVAQLQRRVGAAFVRRHMLEHGVEQRRQVGADLALLQRTVIETGADLGIAHDGDADRCLAVDANGNIIDGDHIMAILAVSMKSRGLLKDDTLVATVMSNLGLELAMAAHVYVFDSPLRLERGLGAGMKEMEP